MTPSVLSPNLSLVPMHASEVKRLAIISIVEIDAERKRRMEEAYQAVKNEVCSHWFGLRQHKLYQDKETAMKYAPEIRYERGYAHGDRETCELLQNAADCLLSEIRIIDKTMWITLNDYRALT